MKNSLLIAVGGNSLIRAGQKGTIEEQIANARMTANRIVDIAARGYRLVITHGNGPQVGSQLLRSEIASSQTYTLPLDLCVAMTQGEIGFVLQNAIESAFRERKLHIPTATIITKVLVDRNDPAFQRPTKPVGPFYSREIAERKRDELGWNIVEDAARGYRRVVASPKPVGIMELEVIQDCLERDCIVIAAGGGGIPVAYDDGHVCGVEAVIDKDRASALLASQLHMERLAISTEVDRVYLDFKSPNRKPLASMTVAEAKQHLAAGQFPEGSMGPKIEAAIDFLEQGGREVIVTNPEHLLQAAEGTEGTHITP